MQDVRKDSRVTVAFQDLQEPAYVTLYGTAEIETDVNQRRKHWREDWAAFFPAGPAGDDYILIKVIPSQIEVMNFARDIAPEPYGLHPLY